MASHPHPRRPRWRSGLPALLAILLLPLASPADMAVTATFGASSRDEYKGAVMAYSGAMYLKFDDMVLLGVQSGIGGAAGPSSIPIAGSAIVRLPLGRVVLPFATGDLGYVLDNKDEGLFWRGGGGFDIKNGRYSSLLLLGGVEAASEVRGWFARAGLLLEF
jgi:hypothetical protein